MEDDGPSVFSPGQSAGQMMNLDIMLEVFQYLSQIELVSAATTCKTWRDHALDTLWRHLDSLSPLLALLAPDLVSTRNGDHEMTWPKQPTQAAWDRFFVYADRVRFLEHEDGDWMPDDDEDDEPTPPSFVSSEVFMDMMRFSQQRRRAAIMPHLRSIRWRASVTAPAHQFTTLAPNNLKKIIYSLDDISNEDICRKISLSLPCIADLFPELEQCWLETRGHIHMTAENDEDDTSTAFRYFCQTCRSLKSFKIIALDTPSPVIQELRHLEPQDFLSVSIGWSLHIEDLIAQLRYLVANARCPKRVFLRFVDCPNSLSYSAITSFVSWKNLQSLDIGGTTCDPLLEREILYLASGLKGLQKLNLGAHCSNVNNPGTPITSLPIFAHAFPQLTHLGIYVFIPEDLPTGDSAVPKRFIHLQHLAVGSSYINKDSIAAVAEFLAAICPHGIRLHTVPESSSILSGTNLKAWTVFEHSPEYGWDDVERLIGMAHRVHVGLSRREGVVLPVSVIAAMDHREE